MFKGKSGEHYPRFKRTNTAIYHDEPVQHQKGDLLTKGVLIVLFAQRCLHHPPTGHRD